MRRLANYQPFVSQILRLCAKETEFSCEPPLAQILEENPGLIIALTHATPLSWLPAVSLLGLKAIEAGGRERSPVGVMDNFFFHLPVLRELAHYLSQSDRPLSYEELSTRFRDPGDIDLVLFPEGSNCFFGPPETVQNFRSPKFVELAIETGAPILLGVHSGSEGWSVTVPVSEPWLSQLDRLPLFASSFLEKRLRQTGLLTLPVLPRPMERFTMRCELYRPSLRKADLAEESGERRAQIREEAERVHDRLRTLLDELQ